MVLGIFTGLLVLLFVNVVQAAGRGPEPALIDAGKKGIVAAQLLLGSQYLIGIHAPQDFKAAHSWYGKAANQWDPKAQTVLGLLHLIGTSLQEDAARAATWFQLAALHRGPARHSYRWQRSMPRAKVSLRILSKPTCGTASPSRTLQEGDSLTEAVHLSNVLAGKMSNEDLYEAKTRTRGVRAFAVR